MLALMPRIWRYALVLTGRRADADDLLQSTYERALQAITSWAPGSRLDAWMFRIARNHYLNDRRSSNYRDGRLAELKLVQPDHHDGPASIESRFAFEALRRQVGRLPEEQRSALLLCSLEGLSYAEVADILGVAPGTVASRIARARDSLRASLDSSPPGGEPNKPAKQARPS